MGNSTTRKEAASARLKQIRAKYSRQSLTDNPQPRFIADVMLGRLAKWLRIAGFDVVYSNRYTDDDLIGISEREGRIILSRDTRLLVRKSVKSFIFLESQSIQEQLRQVFKAMEIKRLALLLTRCLSCNELLIDSPRETVRDKVPPFVYQTHIRFKSCPRCGKIFWAGTHRRSVVRTLKKLLSADINHHQ